MKVGSVSENVKKLLELSSVGDDNIYISATNIAHMESSHPSDYAKYKDQLQNILASPDYVGQNPNDNSIEYVKNFIIDNEYVKVAVRLSSGNKYYARSLYVLNKRRVNNFIKKGTLKKVDFSGI
ncbi:MAG: transposase [Lachnospiraceae bacterium]|nr:transposase [Lachnospiraceae bacterium]